jgi:hypothetical protein
MSVQSRARERGPLQPSVTWEVRSGREGGKSEISIGRSRNFSQTVKERPCGENIGRRQAFDWRPDRGRDASQESSGLVRPARCLVIDHHWTESCLDETRGRLRVNKITTDEHGDGIRERGLLVSGSFCSIKTPLLQRKPGTPQVELTGCVLIVNPDPVDQSNRPSSLVQR